MSKKICMVTPKYYCQKEEVKIPLSQAHCPNPSQLTMELDKAIFDIKLLSMNSESNNMLESIRKKKDVEKKCTKDRIPNINRILD